MKKLEWSLYFLNLYDLFYSSEENLNEVNKKEVLTVFDFVFLFIYMAL